MPLWLVRGLLIVGVIFSWEALSGGVDPRVVLLNPALTGRPSLVAQELFKFFLTGGIWPHLAATIAEVVLGLGLGLVGGLILGLVLAYSRGFDQTLTPFMNGLNALPHLALAPFLVSWVGIGLASKVTVSALMALFPIFYNVYQGTKGVRSEWVHALQVMGARSPHILRLIVLPSLVPWLLSGLRTSAGLALVGAVIGEFIGATKGLGYLLLFAQGFLQTNRALAILFILAGWGMALDWLLRRLEQKAHPWKSQWTVRWPNVQRESW